MNSLFSTPPTLTVLLPLLAAGVAAWAGYTFASSLSLRFPVPRFGRKTRLDDFLDQRAEARPHVPVGSRAHRIRTAFDSIQIDAAGSEETYVLLASATLGIAFVLALLLIGLPFLTSLSGLLMGHMFLNGWINRAWNKTRAQIEGELPSLLLRLSATLQTTPNVPAAIETVSATLRADGPLRVWAMDTAARMHAEGYGVIEPIRESAAGISTSLAIAAELIGRVWMTGGAGYAKAFAAAADNLENVLDARVEARAKGSGAQGTVNILTVMTFGMIAFMTQSDAMAQTVDLPLVQILYAAICLLIVFGHRQVSELIDSVV